MGKYSDPNVTGLSPTCLSHYGSGSYQLSVAHQVHQQTHLCEKCLYFRREVRVVYIGRTHYSAWTHITFPTK